ncbi:MAG: hypothetical protein HRT62_20715 [Epibacterium sp.]|nr:hypothetical protein [Epibacterium sp.]
MGSSIAEQVQAYNKALAAVDDAAGRLSGRGGLQGWLPPEGRFAAALLPALLRAPLGGDGARLGDLPDWADAWLAVAAGRAIAPFPPPPPPVLGVPGFGAWWGSIEAEVVPRHRWHTIVATAAIRRALQQPVGQRPSLAALLTMVSNDYDRWFLIDLLQRVQVYSEAVQTPEPDPSSEPLRWLLRQPEPASGWGRGVPTRASITGDPALDALLAGAPDANLWTRSGPGLPPAEALACWLLARQRSGQRVDWSLLPLVPSAVLPLELLIPPAE